MTRLERIKKVARATAINNGHDVKKFQKEPGANAAAAYCATCCASVLINADEHPAHQITGTAITTNCLMKEEQDADPNDHYYHALASTTPAQIECARKWLMSKGIDGSAEARFILRKVDQHYHGGLDEFLKESKRIEQAAPTHKAIADMSQDEIRAELATYEPNEWMTHPTRYHVLFNAILPTPEEYQQARKSLQSAAGEGGEWPDATDAVRYAERELQLIARARNAKFPYGETTGEEVQGMSQAEINALIIRVERQRQAAKQRGATDEEQQRLAAYSATLYQHLTCGPEEPSILTATCSHWKPGKNAGQRRRNEQRRCNQIYEYFKAIGLTAYRHAQDEVIAQGPGFEIRFYYSESATTVYKSLAIINRGYSDGTQGYIEQLREYCRRRHA